MKKKIQKPFNVEAAKNGAKVETRDGRSVRIICYDRKGDCPILALVSKDKIETCLPYTINGFLYTIAGLLRCSDDLVIVEEVECPECPKFNIGDWVIATSAGHSHIWLITAVTSYRYELQDTEGRKDSIDQIIVDNLSRLWTLDDAKPGDVLIRKDGKRPFILKALNSKDYPIAYCGIDSTNSIFISENPWTTASVRPATHEERQQLFNRLREEGYKWDAESLKLTKIRWRDNETPVNGYFIDGGSCIVSHSGWNNSINYNLFAAEKQAKSALAMARISQIMKNDKRFGGAITNEEWNNATIYAVIVKSDNKLFVTTSHRYEYLAFHEREQAKLFLEENEDLVKDYYMMD